MNDFKIHFIDGSTLIHYGKKRRSGRFPFGSGKRPYQSLNKMEIKGINEKIRLANTLGRKLSPEQVLPNRHASQNDVKIQKGSDIQHISGVSFNKLRPGQLYATFDERDNAQYAAFLGAKLKEKLYTPMKVVIKAKNDINVPSESNQKKIFDSLLNDNKKQIVKDLTDYCNSKNKKIPISDDDIYNMFIASLERPSKSQSLFYEKLTKNGYNGVLDVHDITGSWAQARAPIIILDAINNLGNIKVSELNNSALLDNLDKYLNTK